MYDMVKADGSIPAVQAAAKFACEVQDAVNLYAISNAWLKHVAALRESGVHGDLLNNHPVNLAFISKLKSLCRMYLDREFAALEACDKLAQGEDVLYEVIPL